LLPQTHVSIVTRAEMTKRNVEEMHCQTPIGIVGIGISGRSAHNLLKSMGYPSDTIFTFDDFAQNADSNDPQEFIKNFAPKTLIVSPGYPLQTPWLQEFIRNGGEISSELTLASTVLKDEKIIAVSGSVGKSTVVSLLEAGFPENKKNIFVGGNLGSPLANYALQILNNKRTRADWIILELSSFQLENCNNLQCDYAAITSFFPNHLERYKSLNDYYETKWKLLNITKSKFFLNSFGGEILVFSQNKENNKKITWLNEKNLPFSTQETANSSLIGNHNFQNLQFSAFIAEMCGWDKSYKTKMLSFSGLPHRIQNLGIHQGVHFIDDSKSTSIESIKCAIDCFKEIDRLLLLLGGRDKNLPWEQLTQLKQQSNLIPIFFGESAEIIKKRTRLLGNTFPTLKAAMIELKKMTKPHDTVLLSPGGTSHDEFKNFVDRGEFFQNFITENYG